MGVKESQQQADTDLSENVTGVTIEKSELGLWHAKTFDRVIVCVGSMDRYEYRYSRHADLWMEVSVGRERAEVATDVHVRNMMRFCDPEVRIVRPSESVYGEGL